MTRLTFRLMILIAGGLLAACAGSPTPGPVPTLAALPTLTASPTPAEATTAAPAPTVVEAASLSPTDTPENTPTPPTLPPLTETPTVTPSLTITDTPTAAPTLSPVPTRESEAVSALLSLALQATVAPIVPTAPASPSPAAGTSAPCPAPPPGGFAAVYAADPALAAQLGCPQGAQPEAQLVASAVQPFERGEMIYVAAVDTPATIYVLFNDGTFRRFDDTWAAGIDPESGGENPPAPLVAPVRGFGKVWRTDADVQSPTRLGVQPESGAEAAVVRFERGRMISLPQRAQIVTLVDDPGGSAGRWRATAGQY